MQHSTTSMRTATYAQLNDCSDSNNSSKFMMYTSYINEVLEYMLHVL